ncbi:type II toxin-antitoxin system VapC family toxin [Haloferula sp. A504]|uniref:type II toxin-antitoxin system VapC family toxin n=1 Tax=Haloferula sp. A504 TaxID=3373601 RepID=UPI0031C33A97|nr:type II toxin-antitoxin system VapC family toxin [Verrucomicrobiaceae bacterium E54]
MARVVLLDTNAYSAYRRGSESVLDVMGQAERVYVTVFVLAELFYGFAGGTREHENRQELGAFLAKPTVRMLHTTEDTAELFAAVKDQLRRKSMKIPTNDLWIVAHCMEIGAVLVTFDRHFDHIEGLRRWRVP